VLDFLCRYEELFGQGRSSGLGMSYQNPAPPLHEELEETQMMIAEIVLRTVLQLKIPC